MMGFIGGIVNILILVVVILIIFHTITDLLYRKQLNKKANRVTAIEERVNQVTQILYRELKVNNRIETACVVDMLEGIEDGHYADDAYIENWRINNKSQITIDE